MYLEERYARMSAQGDQLLRGGCESEIMDASSSRTTRQVDQVPHADPVGDFPQFRAAGREEAAHQTIAAELFHPVLPALGAKTQPVEDPGQLFRDRGFSLAKESARIFDQI
jgi:hypothetical protein